ncbi:hypothetical protein [uncultured Roseibium sp.]|uniref:hypothetical protein n=1 Tax=uncultured Roseibium sp. TaxID=1936171 RepID=UPI00262ECC49|nr:hypothetical protein [uncultured Roseibium sp.]
MLSSIRALIRSLKAAVNPDRYRPELHYMRGPGPACREQKSRAGDGDTDRA